MWNATHTHTPTHTAYTVEAAEWLSISWRACLLFCSVAADNDDDKRLQQDMNANCNLSHFVYLFDVIEPAGAVD